jgi:hypothetical protein
LTTYAHNSKLQAITVQPLISAIHKSPQYTLSRLQLAVSSPAVPCQRLLTVEILQLHALRFYLHSIQCKTKRSSLCLLLTSRHGPHRKHRSSIVAFVSVAAGTSLQRCFPETAVARTTENTYCCALVCRGRYLATAAVYRLTA